jgi:hypothetical protein
MVLESAGNDLVYLQVDFSLGIEEHSARVIADEPILMVENSA